MYIYFARRINTVVRLLWHFSTNLLISIYHVHIDYCNDAFKGSFVKYFIQCVIVLRSQHYNQRMRLKQMSFCFCPQGLMEPTAVPRLSLLLLASFLTWLLTPFRGGKNKPENAWCKNTFKQVTFDFNDQTLTERICFLKPITFFFLSFPLPKLTLPASPHTRSPFGSHTAVMKLWVKCWFWHAVKCAKWKLIRERNLTLLFSQFSLSPPGVTFTCFKQSDREKKIRPAKLSF